MIHIKIRLFTLLLLSLGFSGLHAQNVLKVTEKTGTQTFYALSNIRKLTFPAGNLLINKTDGSLQMFAYSKIRLLNFGGTLNNINQPVLQEDGGLLLYPNPVINELTLVYQSIYKGSLQIDIVDLHGKVVFTKTAYQTEGTNQLNINLSNLPKGFYLCRLTRGLTIETIKFLKN
jgi:hypothetical protein